MSYTSMVCAIGGLQKCAKFGCSGHTFQGCWLLLILMMFQHKSMVSWSYNHCHIHQWCVLYVAMGDRFWLFIQTLNNDKKPFNSIFNSKTKSNYSFKEFIHSKTKLNYSFKEFIHSNWKKLFKIRSKICKSEIWKIVLKKSWFCQKVLKFHLPTASQRNPPNSQSFIASPD